MSISITFIITLNSVGRIITWDAKDQPGGTYYYVLFTGNGPNNPNKVYKGSITVVK
jgi:hypothetical protein